MNNHNPNWKPSIQAINFDRLKHMKAVVETALDLQKEGYRVDILQEPSSFDIFAWKQGEFLFVEVKTGKPALTDNEKLFAKAVESNPALKYGIVQQ